MTHIRRLTLIAAVFGLIALQACSQVDSDPVTDKTSDGSNASGRVDRYTLRDVTYPVIPIITYEYAYQVFVPSRHNVAKALPLFVMVHGCGTTADEQMYANELNELAQTEGFLVMYPDNGGECWRAVVAQPDSMHRGAGGDADILVEMTQATMQKYNVDPERVYMIGMSAGAFQTTATAAAYPEIYAAVGVMAGGGYGMNVGCVELPDEAAPAHAPLAIAEMGLGARVIPFIAIGGTLDPLGEGGPHNINQATPAIGGCSRMAFIEAMTTNNLLGSNRYALDPASTEQGQVPDGYAWTKEVWRDTAGCEIGERWVVHGMSHYWSGGSSDPQWAEWTDPKGPSASRAAWEFFRRYRKSDTGNECAETAARE
jgi:poly(hydroxyalkanoate) depolymerase family esterase